MRWTESCFLCQSVALGLLDSGHSEADSIAKTAWANRRLGPSKQAIKWKSRKRGKAVLDARSYFCLLSCPPLVCGKCKEEDNEFRGWASMRRTIKKMQVVVMATQGFSSAAEAVSFPARRTGSYFTPLSLVQSNIQVTDMLPAATWNRHTRQITNFPETKSSCPCACCRPLCYSFPPPDIVQ